MAAWAACYMQPVDPRVKTLIKERIEHAAQAMEAEARELRAVAAISLTGSSRLELNGEALILELASHHVRELLARLLAS